MIGRRSFIALGAPLALAALTRSRSARAAAEAGVTSALDVRVVTLAKRRVLLAVPHGATRVRIAVLLHGLGETGDPELGARAWADRYGLLSCDDRLRNPPIARTSARRDLPDDVIARLDADLATAPFRGLAYVCPHMPNLQSTPGALDYGAWLTKELLPAARTELGIASDPRVALGGCSLGAYVALEIAASGDPTFEVLACVQSAISTGTAARFASKLQQKIYLSTSTWDPYRAANEALSKELVRLSKDVTFRSFPGPHDQPWLREVGSLDLAAWLDRSL